MNEAVKQKRQTVIDNGIEVDVRPWHREPWVWFMIGGIVAVMIGVAVTLVFALRSPDSLVRGDYYKEGLAINQTLDRTEQSTLLNLRADLNFLPDGTVQAILKSKDAAFRPEGSIELRLLHSRQSELDRTLQLTAVGPLTFVGQTLPPQEGNWQVLLENPKWRLATYAKAPFTTIELSWDSERQALETPVNPERK